MSRKTLEPGAYIPVSEIAAHLDMTPRGIRKMASRGDLPAIKIGSVWPIPRREFLAWLKKREPKPWRAYTGGRGRRIGATALSEDAENAAVRLRKRLGLVPPERT